MELVHYMSTTPVQATRMKLGEYNDYRGFEAPNSDNPEREGYLVQSETGHQKWTCKLEFEAYNRKDGNFSFGHALDKLAEGHKVARAGWNGKGMWLMLVRGTCRPRMAPGSAYAEALGEYAAADGIVDQISIDSHIDMFTAGQTMQPGWLGSQADMLANDWSVV